MDPMRFFEGMKTDHEDFTEKVAAAEHFIRLKKQAGIFGASVPDEIEHAAIPYDQRHQIYGNYLKQKAQENPTGYGKGMLGGGIMGAIPGAIAGGLRGGLRGAGTGALIGGGLGAGAGAIAAAGDKINIREAKSLQNKDIGPALAKAITSKIDDREDRSEFRDEVRHERLRAAVEKRASIDPKMIAMMGLGAAAGGTLAHVSSKPRDSLGGQSSEEDLMGRVVAGNKTRPEEGLGRKMVNRTAELGHGLARAFREHPGKATAIGTGGGALAGMSVGKMLGLALKAKDGR